MVHYYDGVGAVTRKRVREKVNIVRSRSVVFHTRKMILQAWHPCRIDGSGEELSSPSPFHQSHKRINPPPREETCTTRRWRICARWWPDPNGTAVVSPPQLVGPVFQSRWWRSNWRKLCSGKSSRASWFWHVGSYEAKPYQTMTLYVVFPLQDINY